MKLPLDQRPVLVALAGPNGSGKTTFYHAHLRRSGLRLVNADILAKELWVDAYTAATMAGVIRQRLVEQRESFVFETVFSDPVSEKVTCLQNTAKAGYNVVLCFVGVSGPATSEQRVAMRVSQGGHDVPSEKLVARYPRTLANLKAALRTLPQVFIFDNEDLARPFRQLAIFKGGKPTFLAERLPDWLKSVFRY